MFTLANDVFTSITELPLSNRSIVFCKNFRNRVFTKNIYFEVPRVQKCGFQKLNCAVHVSMMYMCMCGKYSAFFISKINKG